MKTYEQTIWYAFAVLMKSINLGSILCLGCWFGPTIFDCKCRKITNGLAKWRRKHHNTHCLWECVSQKCWQNIISFLLKRKIPWWFQKALDCLHHPFYQTHTHRTPFNVAHKSNNCLIILCKFSPIVNLQNAISRYRSEPKSLFGAVVHTKWHRILYKWWCKVCFYIHNQFEGRLPFHFSCFHDDFEGFKIKWQKKLALFLSSNKWNYSFLLILLVYKFGWSGRVCRSPNSDVE